MTQTKSNVFIDENYSKPPKNNYITNKTDAYRNDDTRSLDILDSKNFGPENKRGHR